MKPVTREWVAKAEAKSAVALAKKVREIVRSGLKLPMQRTAGTRASARAAPRATRKRKDGKQ